MELLAAEAPPSRFETLLHQARRAGGPEEDSEELVRLERAVHLAGGIQAARDRRDRREAGLAALVDTARDLTSPPDLDSLLKMITGRARRLLNFDMTYVSMEADEGDFVIRASEGAAAALRTGLRTKDVDGLGRYVRKTGMPQWTEHYLRDERIEHSDTGDAVMQAEGLHAVMAVPLRRDDTVIGVLFGANRMVRHYTPDDLSLMCLLADLAAAAIERAGLLERTSAEVAELERDTSRARTSITRMLHLSDTYSRLMNVALAGGSLTEVARMAGDYLNTAVAVRDPGGQLQAYVGALPDLDGTALAQASLDAHAARRPVEVGGVWIAPVVVGPESLGDVVLGPTTALGAEDVRLLHHLVQAVAVLLLMRRGTSVAGGPARDELLDDLLSSPPPPPYQIAQRTRALGIDLARPHVLLVARPEDGRPRRAAVWAASYAHRMSGLKTVQDDLVVLLLPGDDPSAAARAASDELTGLLGHPVSVGAAGPVEEAVGGTRRMYPEARRCLEALTALQPGGSASAQDLGFLGLLLAERHDVSGFIESTIGPLLEYDAQRPTDLVSDVEAYFACGGSPTQTAETRHVHPNTVSRRLERVSALLGTGWQRPDRALEIQLALRLHRTRAVLSPQ